MDLRGVLLEKVPQDIVDRIMTLVREAEKEDLHKLLVESLPHHMANSITSEELDRLLDKKAVVLKKLAAMPGVKPRKGAARRLADALTQVSPKIILQRLKAGSHSRQGLFPAICDRPLR